MQYLSWKGHTAMTVDTVNNHELRSKDFLGQKIFFDKRSWPNLRQQRLFPGGKDHVTAFCAVAFHTLFLSVQQNP